jgi:nicotinamidase-related amidase
MIDSFEDHCWKDIMSQEDLEIYKAYKRETYIGQRPALLAIDLYNLVFSGGSRPVHEVVKEYPSSCGSYAWAAIEPIKELLTIVRSVGIPIIYVTRETRQVNDPETLQSTKRQMSKTDDRSFEIRDDFRPESNDMMIFKERASAFFGTPLSARLVQRGIDSLIVCGESTSGCLRASVVDAYSHGFHTVVVEECCFDRCLLCHKVNLFDLHHKYADVMHLEEVKEHVKNLKNNSKRKL